MDPTALNKAQNEVFRHFLEFGWYVFLETEHDDSSGWCLSSSKDKFYKKVETGDKFGPDRPKSVSGLGSSPLCQFWFISFPLNCIEWYLGIMFKH